MFSGKLAESAAPKIDKGTCLFAEGVTEDDKWEDKHKQKRVTKSVRVDTYRIIPVSNTGSIPSPENLMSEDEIEAYINGGSS